MRIETTTDEHVEVEGGIDVGLPAWRIVTAHDDQAWPCTIVDSRGRSLLGMHDGTPIFRDRAHADRVLAALNAPPEPLEATSVTEWGYQVTTQGSLVTRTHTFQEPTPDAAQARVDDLDQRLRPLGYFNGQEYVDAEVMSRTRTSYADRVSEWSEVRRG